MLRRFWRRLTTFFMGSNTQTARPWYRRSLLALAGVVTLLVLIVPGYSSVARAAEPGTFTEIGNGILWGLIQALLGAARVFISMSLFFMRALIEFAKYNNYMDSPPVIQGWYLVRDLANMAFIVALLVIAFATILGLESYEWKKSLGKIVIAAILINFSRLICQVALDAAHVVTMGFINAIEAAAGGNVINMLHLNQVLKMVGQSPDSATFTSFTNSDDIRLEIFASAMIGAIFALIAMLSMAAYAAIMAIRVAILWVLMILSPIAFVLGAIPQTQSTAQEFWQEFMKYVAVGPILTFFFWLALASMGSGDINKYVGIPPEYGSVDKTESLELFGPPRTTLSEVSTWENMSAFLISVIFLMVGLERVSKVGVIGGDFAGNVFEFGKTAVKVGSGFALGRWTAGKTQDLAVGTAYHLPLVGGKVWENRAKSLGQGIRGTFYGVAASENVARGGMYNPANWIQGMARNAINNEKRAGDLEEVANIKKELAEKAISTKAFFEFDKDGDRKGYGDVKRELAGKLEALQERSDVKSSRIKAEAKMDTLAKPRVQDGVAKKDKAGKVVTLADDLEQNRVKAETTEKKLAQIAPKARLKLILEAKEAAEKAGKPEHETLIGNLIHEEEEAHKIELEQSSRFSTLMSAASQHEFEEENANRDKHEKTQTEKKETIDDLEKLLGEQKGDKATIDKVNAALDQKRRDLLEMNARVNPSPSQLDERFALDNDIKADEINVQKMNAELTDKNGNIEKLEQKILALVKEDPDSDVQTIEQLRAVMQYDWSQTNHRKTAKELSGVDEQIKKLEKTIPPKPVAGQKDAAEVQAKRNAIAEQLRELREKKNNLTKKETKEKKSADTYYRESMAQLGYDTQMNPKTGNPKNEDDVRATASKIMKKAVYQSDSSTYRSMTAEIDDTFGKRELERAQETIKSELEGDRIWNKHIGATLPTSANRKSAEWAKGQLSDMQYDQTVAASADSAVRLIMQQLQGEKVSKTQIDLTAGLALRAFEHQGFDDIGFAVMDNKEVRAALTKKLNWKGGKKMDRKQTGQIMRLMMTGWDIDLEEQVSALNEFLEVKAKAGRNVKDDYEELALEYFGGDKTKYKKYLEAVKPHANNFQMLSAFTDQTLGMGHDETGGHAANVKSLGMSMPMPETTSYNLANMNLSKISPGQKTKTAPWALGTENEFGLLVDRIEEKLAAHFGHAQKFTDLRDQQPRMAQATLLLGAREKIKTDDKDFTVVGQRALDLSVIQSMDLKSLGLESEDDVAGLSSGRVEQIKGMKEFVEKKREMVFEELAKELRANAPRVFMNAISANPVLRRNAETNKSSGTINVVIPNVGLANEGRLGTDNEMIGAVNVYIKEKLDRQLKAGGISADDHKRMLREQSIPLSIRKGDRPGEAAAEAEAAEANAEIDGANPPT